MGSAKSSGSKERRIIRNPAKQRLSWSFSMKEVVHIIHNDFAFAPQVREEIFFQFFKTEIRRSGFDGPVPHSRLSAQWCKRRKKNKDWMEICSSVHSQREQKRKADLKVQIQVMSRSLRRPAPATTRRQRSQLSRSKAKSSQVQNQRLAKIDQTHTHVPANRDDQEFVAPNGRRKSQPQTMRSATPLSKRPAVAHWDPASESEIDVSRPLPKCRRVSRESQPSLSKIATWDASSKQRAPPTPRSSARLSQMQSPPTPKSAGSQRTGRAPYLRPDGSTIMLPQENIDRIPRNLNPQSEHAARPPLPGLLFRYWTEESTCDRDSRQGFTARLYHKSNVIPCRPPTAEYVDLTHVFNHMQRKEEKTPFISTSSRLIWIVHLMLNAAVDPKARLSVIDCAALDKQTVFWARPFHDEMRKKFPFSDGAQRYMGTYEFLVWHKVPGSAIIRTFTPAELQRLVRKDSKLQRILRFEALQGRGSLYRTKIPALKSDGILLTGDLAAAIARLCGYLGLSADMPEKLSHIVSDVIEGWCLRVEKLDEQQWYQLATLFAKEVCAQWSKRLTLADQEKVKFAFLNGVAYGRGKVNCRFQKQLLIKQQRAALAVGLASPAKIIASQLDAAKMVVLSAERIETKRLDAYHQWRVTSASESEDDDDRDEEVEDGDSFGNPTLEEQMSEDSDEEFDESDNDGTVFGFGDNGLII